MGDAVPSSSSYWKIVPVLALLAAIPLGAIAFQQFAEQRAIAKRFVDGLRAHDVDAENLAIEPVRALVRPCLTGACMGDVKLTEALRTLSGSHGVALDGSSSGGFDTGCLAGHLIDASDVRRELVVHVRKHMGAWRVDDVYLEASNGRGCDL